LRSEARFLQQAAALAPAFAIRLGQGQQEHFRGDELVASLLRLLVGDIEQVGQVAADADLAAVAFDLGQAIQRLLPGDAFSPATLAPARCSRDEVEPSS
jgi:hypothetical protein